MSRRRQINETDSTLEIEAILAALRESDEGLSAEDLSDLLDLNRAGRKALTQLLNQLQGAGLLRRYGQRFRWSHSNRALIGHIRQRRRKLIHFIPEEIEERKRGRIRVEPEDVNGAFDGDLVIAGISGSRRDNERSARVEMIL